MFKNVDRNIPGRNFLDGNFPGGNFPGGSLMGGNFPGGSFPDTPFFTYPKSQDKNLNILRTKRAFKMK